MVGNVIWIWGLSGSGKTTLGYRLAQELDYVFIDSDSVRRELEIPRDFSVSGRASYQEALRHYVFGLVLRNINVVVSSITPLQVMRNANHQLFSHYFEVCLKCSLNVLRERDPKGLYKKAFAGDILDLTGVGSPFEDPVNDGLGRNKFPDLIIDTGFHSEEESYIILVNMAKEYLGRL
jgi:adenylylsulfate kinase-like enzyme